MVLSPPAYHRSRQEVIVAAITSNVSWVLFGDHVLSAWKESGLLFPSVVTGILRTIKASMIHRRLGSVPAGEMSFINEMLRKALGLEKKS